jgi:putative copper resistance protein D
MQLAFVQWVSTVMVNASYALMTGVLAAQLWMRHIDDGEHQCVHEKLHAAMGIGFGAGLAATLLSLWQASAIMADVPLLESGPSLWVMFADTSYGHFGLVSLLILALGGVLHFALRHRNQSSLHQWAVLGVLLAFAICRVATGHAAENGLFGLATVAELVHVLSMALWFGSVIVAAWIVIPTIGRTALPSSIAPYLKSLSSWATVALAAVLTTGIYNAIRVLNKPAELGTTEYGWVLTTKLCFVGIAIALGAWNRFSGFPAVEAASESVTEQTKLRVITSILRVESIALLFVLLAAAVLTANAPPAWTDASEASTPK